MKKLIFSIAVALELVASAAEQTDKRNIGGSVVDLTPVRKWLADRHGERPLKHWKEVHIKKIVGNTAGLDQCEAEIEGAGYSEILLSHMPPETKAYFNDQTQLETMEAEIAEASKKTENTHPAGNTKRARVVAHPVVSQAQLQTLRKQVTTMQEKQKANQSHAKVLAMFTGRNMPVSGKKMEVWDCGVMMK